MLQAARKCDDTSPVQHAWEADDCLTNIDHRRSEINQLDKDQKLAQPVVVLIKYNGHVTVFAV